MEGDLLIDTHVFIWLMEGDETLPPKVQKLLKQTSQKNVLYISAISIWEIAMLQSKKRLSLTLPLSQWLDQAITLPFLKIVNINKEIAIESCTLPGEFHGDPADRMIVASSRILNVPLVTRDQKILSYAKLSFVNTIKC